MIERPFYCPELSLVLEVIRRAVYDAIAEFDTTGAYAPRFRHKYNTIARQAEAWILSRETREWSCYWCCEQLGVSQRAVIKHMIQLKTDGVVRGPGKKPYYGTGLKAVLQGGNECELKFG
jgi:hypothetical protein